MARHLYAESLKPLCGDKAAAGGDAARDPTEVFRALVCKLLLGDAGRGAAVRPAQAGTDAKGRLNIDLVFATCRAAVAELTGQSGDAEARRGLSLLESAAGADAANYQVVESALALSALAGDGRAVKRWYEAGVALPQASKTSWTFELLFLSTLKSPDDEALASAANAVARSAHDVLWAAPYYSAAPHVCLLASLARGRGQTADGLLRGRAGALDEVVFGAGGKPRLSFSDPAFRFERPRGHAAVLEVEVTADGDGAFDPGAYDLAAVTRGLPQTIQAASDKVERMRGAKRDEHRSLFESALYRKTGTCHVSILLGPKVALTEQGRRLWLEKVRVGWEVAGGQLDKLKGQLRAEVKTRPSKERAE
ncbi:MAG TPA: hypothetical protein VM936_11130 [Pyrinomonadaceae bacterium]|jgi:hypothetical protein|nr:hypothetical protein [Pyrinomonadaceae bacterium]